MSDSVKIVITFAVMFSAFISGYEFKALQAQATAAEFLQYTTKLESDAEAIAKAKSTCTCSNEAALRWWTNSSNLTNVRSQLCSVHSTENKSQKSKR